MHLSNLKLPQEIRFLADSVRSQKSVSFSIYGFPSIQDQNIQIDHIRALKIRKVTECLCDINLMLVQR